MLAEDEVLVRLDVAEELRRAGWKVIEVASADDAIDILNSPVIVDILVTDVNMRARRTVWISQGSLAGNDREFRL